MVLALATAILLGVMGVHAVDMYCRDENGDAIDWFIMLKYPEISSASSGYTDGYTYYYLDAKNRSSFKEGVTKLSNSSKGALAYTLKQIYDNANSSEIGYAMYDDDAPEPYSDSSYRAHAKGVVAVNNSKKGFWLVHSVPNFPDDPAVNSKYSFPSYETDYGQSFLCMSLTGSSMDTVGDVLYYNMPNYYVKHIPSSLQSMYPKLYDAVMNDAHTSSAATTAQYLNFSVNKGSISQALALGKTKSWGKDFWDDLVAPTLKSDLAVETWKRGSELGPNCGSYKVVDVSEVKVGKYSWSETKDHSKWGISLRSAYGGSHSGAPWVCVGDINRMESQESRGGGAVCFEDSTLWGAFDALIVSIEDC